MQRQNLPGCRMRTIASFAVLSAQYVVFKLGPLVCVVGWPGALRQAEIDNAIPDYFLGDTGMIVPDRVDGPSLVVLVRLGGLTEEVIQLVGPTCAGRLVTGSALAESIQTALCNDGGVNT